MFSGLNDVGKSNVLKALNLFFNNQTDFGSYFDFNADYSKVSLASAQRSSKKKQQVKIKVYFIAPSSFKSLSGEELWIERVYDRLGVLSEHSSLGNSKKRSLLTRLLNNIQYFYIPALKGPDVLQYLLGEVGKRKLIDASDIADLNEKVNKNIVDLATMLTQSSIKTITKFELPVLVEDFWQSLNINTEYDEFSKLNTEINPSKKGNSDSLNKEFYQISLQLRGEGVKSKYIPPLLQWIQEREPNRQYVWGIDEPENSLEFRKAQEIADLYFGSYSKKTQLFLTSHSLAFIFPGNHHQSVSVFRCVRGKFGETQIELFDSLFKEQDKYNLAEEVGALEIQKEIIEEWRSKDSQIKTLKGQIASLTKPVVFVEGELDEAYFKKTLEVFDKARSYPADIKWIGRKGKDGQSTFTGRSALERASKFLSVHKPAQKTVLLYDVDCDKETTTQGNLTTYCPSKIENARYQTGTEHLLVVPKGFDDGSAPYVEKKNEGDKQITQPNKVGIKNYVFSLPSDQQKAWLANIDKIIEELKTNYLS